MINVIQTRLFHFWPNLFTFNRTISLLTTLFHFWLNHHLWLNHFSSLNAFSNGVLGVRRDDSGHRRQMNSQLTEPFYNCILTSVLKPFLNCIEHILFHYTILHNNTQAIVFTLYHFLTIGFILQTTTVPFGFSQRFHFNVLYFSGESGPYRRETGC